MSAQQVDKEQGLDYEILFTIQEWNGIMHILRVPKLPLLLQTNLATRIRHQVDQEQRKVNHVNRREMFFTRLLWWVQVMQSGEKWLMITICKVCQQQSIHSVPENGGIFGLKALHQILLVNCLGSRLWHGVFRVQHSL